MKEPTPDVLVAATAEEIVAAIASDAARLSMFRRRFILALGDVGWLSAVGTDWVRIGAGGIEFAPLTLNQADVVLRDLEGLARGRAPQMHCSGPGQLRLF